MSLAYKQLSLLPWLELNSIQVGNAIFWKYDPSIVTEPDTKAYLDKYVMCYVDKHLEPAKTISVASYKDKDYFEVLTAEEYQELNFARNILCFLFICEQTRIALSQNNFSIGPPSADIFDMVSQNFIPGTDDISVRSGSMTSGGWKLHEIKFQEPWSTGGFFKNLNRHMLSAINDLLSSQNHNDVKNRLLLASEWFRLAHIENGVISPFFRIVTMATAFEILFDIPNVPNKSGFFADKIDEKLGGSDFVKETRMMGRNNSINTERSKMSWWGWDFYKLRNSIVHGDNIPIVELTYSDWITHAIIADILFYSYIGCLLNELGYITSLNAPDFEGIYKLVSWKL